MVHKTQPGVAGTPGSISGEGGPHADGRYTQEDEERVDREYRGGKEGIGDGTEAARQGTDRDNMIL